MFLSAGIAVGELLGYPIADLLAEEFDGGPVHVRKGVDVSRALGLGYSTLGSTSIQIVARDVRPFCHVGDGPCVAFSCYRKLGAVLDYADMACALVGPKFPDGGEWQVGTAVTGILRRSSIPGGSLWGWQGHTLSVEERDRVPKPVSFIRRTA